MGKALEFAPFDFKKLKTFPKGKMDQTFAQKVASASVSSLLVALLTTPLDVLKTRMQTSHINRSMVSIASNEGIRALWRGITPTIVMNTPSTVIYYLGYEVIRDTLVAQGLGSWSSPISGCFARASPIELVRTRMQFDSKALNLTDLRTLSSFWKGLAPTLWRDVPFSGIYWYAFETSKSLLLKSKQEFERETTSPHLYLNSFSIAFISGAGSGMLAATLTSPFDVCKTIAQTENTARGMWPILRNVYDVGGVRGLFAGLGPRVGKVAPSCAIMISSYEFLNDWWRS